MTIKKLMLGSLLALLSAGTADAALKGAKLAKGASISLSAARITALRVRPGRITDQEFERERGGSGLRYSFDITSRGRAYEVGVDAKTGAVLENARESSHPD